MTKILTFIRREPVRAVLIPLITALVAYLVARGALTDATAPIVLAAVAIALGVPATEVIRSKVTPVSFVEAKVSTAVSDTITAARQVLVSELPADARLAEIGVSGTEIADRVADQIATYTGRHRGV